MKSMTQSGEDTHSLLSQQGRKTKSVDKNAFLFISTTKIIVNWIDNFPVTVRFIRH